MLSALSKWSYQHSLAGAVSLGLVMFPINILASSFQNFAGINYSNPADLSFLVNDMQFIIGDSLVAPNTQFNGQVTVPDRVLPKPYNRSVRSSGISENNDKFNLPYGRFAKRLTSQLVAGIDITQPFKEDIVYSNNSAARYSATKTSISSVDISPNFAFRFPGKLANLSLGAGFDAVDFSAEFSQMYPSLPVVKVGRPPVIIPFGAGSDIAISNKADDLAYGWHAGATYHLFVGTLVGLSYFSAITPKVTGQSTFSGLPTSNNLSADIDLPATTNLDIRQFINDRWMMKFSVNYTEWSRLNQIVFENTAAPVPTQTANSNYRDTWRFAVGTRYAVIPKLALLGLAAYDQNPTNDTDRTLRSFGGDMVTLGGAMEYKLTKAVAVSLEYAHLFSKDAPVNQVNPNNGATTQGTLSGSANALGLKLVVNT